MAASGAVHVTRAERVSAGCEIVMVCAFVAFIVATAWEQVRTARKVRETVDFAMWERESDGL